MFSKCLKIRKKHAQKAIILLDLNSARNNELKVKSEKDFVFIPVKTKKPAEQALKKSGFEFGFAETDFDSAKRKPRSLKEALKPKLSEKEMSELITSFNTIGDLAVIEVPDSLESREKLIGEAIIETSPQIKVVCKKTGITQGVFRVHPVKVIAGEKRTEAIYKEHGTKLLVDVGKVFFSPRLSTERLRISKLIRSGETVAALFAGVGPFPIVFAKNSKMKKAFAVELNPDAVKAMEKNIKSNKMVSRIEPILGDVNKVVPERLLGKCDRAVMPLPKGGETFLDAAIQSIKPTGGVVHFYKFVSVNEPYKKPLNWIKEACRRNSRKCKVLRKAKVRNFSPKIIQIVIDFWVEENAKP